MFTPKKLYAPLATRLSQLKIEEPTPVQKEALPKIKSGADVFVVAPTGAGKTSLAAIYLLHKLKAIEDEEDIPRAIVIVPTKDKVMEFKALMEDLGNYSHLRVKCAYSEEDLERQRDEIYLGSEVVVGTAKRLGELYTGTGLNIRLVNTIIVDDFDEITKQDALAQIERLLVANPKVQKLFFAGNQPSLMCKIIDKVSGNLITIKG
jgi:superfamily II DNA/RNA helicase